MRDRGCSVETLHQVGGGCPDLLVGVNGQNFLIEVKNASKPPSKQCLRHKQIAWHSSWKGHTAVVSTVEEAIVAVLGIAP